MLYPIQDASVELFGGNVITQSSDSDAQDLIITMTTPLSYDGTWRRAWYQIRKNGPGFFLKPLDMYCEYLTLSEGLSVLMRYIKFMWIKRLTTP
jgi:hypothetical protein